MPPEISDGAQVARAAQADRVELHQHDVADHRLGEIGVLAQREGDVLEHGHVGEQRAELEQHAHLAAQRVQAVARLRADVLPVEQHLAATAPATSPPIRRSTVVLPQPDPPMTATTWPRVKRMFRVSLPWVDDPKAKAGQGIFFSNLIDRLTTDPGRAQGWRDERPADGRRPS